MECVQAEINTNPNHSPLMFYSEDEDIGEKEDDVNEEDGSNLDDNTVISVVNSRDEQLISQIKLLMTGVPPPPSFTTSKLDVSEILRLWNNNQQIINEVTENYDMERKSATTLVETEAKEMSWPEVIHIETFDVYYNKSKASEDLALLFLKYKERFIGKETSSWTNSVCKSPVRTASAKKRARYPGWGHSPGRRLSHLARRRRAFTSANLQSLSGKNSGLPRDKKMILVEMKKPNNQITKSKSSSVKKQHPVVKIKDTFMSGPKRALFQSPDEKPSKSVKPLSRHVKLSPNQLRIQRSKRALWPDEQSGQNELLANGKRARKTLTPSPRKKCNRNLFSDRAVPKSTSHVMGNLQLGQQSNPLSNPHQKKLLWAISQALRDEGIRMNHQIFQSCLSVLNGPCKALWIWQTSKNIPRGSTSENMLAMVKQFAINNVIEQVQINSSSSNLICLRLELMKKVESIKCRNDGQIVKLKSEEYVETLVKPKIDKENISEKSSSVSDLNCTLFRKSPLKDKNTKSDTPCTSDKVKHLSDNSNETKVVKSDDEPFNGFDIQTDIKNVLEKSPVKSNTEETKRIVFSELLSWNADPISRLQVKAPDLSDITLNLNPVSDSAIVLDQTHTDRENLAEGNLMFEFETNDDETRSSSIYSFDLNNFVEESNTCFDHVSHFEET